MTCNTCGGWGDYPVAGPYPELTITHEPCPECAMNASNNRRRWAVSQRNHARAAVAKQLADEQAEREAQAKHNAAARAILDKLNADGVTQ